MAGVAGNCSEDQADYFREHGGVIMCKRIKNSFVVANKRLQAI